MSPSHDPDAKAGHGGDRSGQPSPWVVRFAANVPQGGRVLDVAAGGGRHARLFLGRGARVTCIDRDISGLMDLSGEAEIIAADLEDGRSWPLAGRGFDAVVVVNYLFRPLLADMVASVAPGGVLIYATFGLGNEIYGKPRNPDHLLRPGELLEAVAERMIVIAYEAGREDTPSGPRVVQRICAMRPGEPRTIPALPR